MITHRLFFILSLNTNLDDCLDKKKMYLVVDNLLPACALFINSSQDWTSDYESEKLEADIREEFRRRNWRAVLQDTEVCFCAKAKELMFRSTFRD
jgi:hypothetical protein